MRTESCSLTHIGHAKAFAHQASSRVGAVASKRALGTAGIQRISTAPDQFAVGAIGGAIIEASLAALAAQDAAPLNLHLCAEITRL